MKRALLIIGTSALAWMWLQAADRPQLKLYIVSKDPGKGLQPATYPAFPNLGYIGEKPDFTISELESVSYGSRQGVPKLDGGFGPPREDPHSLQFQLTASDAASVGKLTKEHVDAGLLLMLDKDPLVAVRIRTPLTSQLMGITVPVGLKAEEIKAKLEKLVQKPKQSESSATPSPQAGATATPQVPGTATATPKPSS